MGLSGAIVNVYNKLWLEVFQLEGLFKTLSMPSLNLLLGLIILFALMNLACSSVGLNYME